MPLTAVYLPIQDSLNRVEAALGTLASQFDGPTVRQIAQAFLSRPGKMLRPALLLLSARTVPDSQRRLAELEQAALGVELIHSASLIHDDVLDRDEERRGQPTVNGAWGNGVAVLAGDVLYSRAFGTLTHCLPLRLLRAVVSLNESMCGAEIEQARFSPPVARAVYFDVIEGKTAAFMALSCRLGAELAQAPARQVETLAEFGRCFGLAYQLLDDARDGDCPCSEVDAAVEGREYARRALALLEGLPGAESLAELPKVLFSLTAQEVSP